MTDSAATFETHLSRVEQTRAARQVFVVAFGVRLLLVLAFCLAPNTVMRDLSRDSASYDIEGRMIAHELARGEMQWDRWLDDGWFQFIGLVYYMFGPYKGVVMAINAALAGLAAVLVYRIAAAVFSDDAVARLSAYVFALFPSIVYYTSIPLKEAASLVGVLSVAWGVVRVSNRSGGRGFLWILLGGAILAGVRTYLSIIVLGCAVVCLIPWRIARGWAGVAQVGLGILICVAGAAGAAHLYGLRPEQHSALRVFDIEHINHVRGSLSRGNTRMFDDRQEAAWGQGLGNDAKLAAKAAYYFLFSIDPTDVKRKRQLAALPEVLFFFYCLPYIVAGVRHGWQRAPNRVLPVVLFAVALAGIFAGVTTNMGALYRWRAQALPFVIMLIAYGAAVRNRGMLSRVLAHIRGAMQVRTARLLAVASR